jgi:hypothetical protein
MEKKRLFPEHMGCENTWLPFANLSLVNHLSAQEQALPEQRRLCELFSRLILKPHQAEDILIPSGPASGINLLPWNNKIWNETVHE